MKNALRPTNIYKLEGGRIECELKAYAGALDKAGDCFDKLLREMFVQTACGWGLSARESVFGRARGELSAEERRQRLLYRLSLLPGDFTPDGVARALKSEGVENRVTENFAGESLSFEGLSLTGDPALNAWVCGAAEEMLPCHLGYSLNLLPMTFDMLDALDRAFDKWDMLGLKWEYFD